VNLVGRTTIGTLTAGAPADTKVVEAYTLPACQIVKLTAYVDGLGAGGGDQVSKPVIYTAAGALVAVGDEVTVRRGQSPAWMDFPFSAYKGGVVLAAGSYGLGFHYGGVAQSMTRYYDSIGGASQRTQNADTYADGPSATFGTSTTTNNVLFSWFASYTLDWASDSSDLYDLAQLPLAAAQRALAATAAVTTGFLRLSGQAGWHGSSFDDGQASFVIADADGPFADRVGHVLKITLDQALTARTVWAFCHRAADLDPGDDLSLPRPLFLALGLLNTDSVPVGVEVVS
jgi:hypothetical protein